MAEKNLKVILISPLPPPAGGIASWTEQYIEWADKNNLNVEIVDISVVGNRAKRINSKRNFIDEVERTKKIIKDLNYKLRYFKPDVVHLNTSCNKLGIFRDYLCAKIIKRKKIKLFIHYRCNIEDQIGNGTSQRYILRKIIKIADKNFVLNDFSGKYIYKISGEKSVLISNFINSSHILSKPKFIRQKVRIASFVGHVQREKGIFEIIDVAEKFPEIIFKLAGPVADELRNKSIPRNVLLLGPISKKDVFRLLAESDVFIFPSYTEGFANALLEAMSQGVPVISTGVGANENMIENKGGIIIEVANKNELIDAIRKIEPKKIREVMSEWNRKKVILNYTIEEVMKDFIRQYTGSL